MSKKTLNIISVCIILIIITFSIKNKNTNKSIYSENIVIDENGNISTQSNKYRESILKTVEDENVRNFEKLSQSFKKNSSDNLTDTLSKDIFTQYIKYNTSGNLEQSQVDKITNEILKNSNIDTEDLVTYSDIKTNTSNMNNLKLYANNMIIIQDGINKGILSIEKKNNKTPYIASIYNTTAKLLTNVEVPELLSQEHINIINGYKNYSNGMYLLDQQDNDPAKALLGLKKIKDSTEQLTKSFEKINKTIILNKDMINFTENDPGILWIKNYENSSIKTQ